MSPVDCQGESPIAASRRAVLNRGWTAGSNLHYCLPDQWMELPSQQTLSSLAM